MSEIMEENKNKKTGLKYLDEFSKEERKQAFKNMREYWSTLTPEQQTQHFDTYYTVIREKKKENDGRLMNASDFDVMREVINVDLPKVRENAILEAEKNGRLDIAQDLRERRIGLDTFAINIVEEDKES
jgi:hypothetical protein